MRTLGSGAYANLSRPLLQHSSPTTSSSFFPCGAWLSSVIFLAPLVYVMNKEFIDAHLENTSRIVSEQAQQVKSMAGEHAGKGFEAVKSYTGDYASKASDLVGKSRQKIPAMPQPTTNQPAVKENDFPNAPKTDLPSEAAATEPEPIPAT